ncbi:MAG: isoleucine--tRNA ligase [Chloroflexi bacterium HGW-Chloroflexi-10]|nr:MAG: isoleucine--tRNA ligase [Chloroflexi bacterium HGW-Chloroflexi-10]
MFKPVTPKLNVNQSEEEILQFWKDEDIFQKTLQERRGGPEYVFYEGPPTANGRPGVHHVLARAFKDIFPRYKTMRGYYVSRRGGWDTHGLPVEIEVEKQLGFHNKQDIENYGIAKFNALCKESAFTYIQEWEKLTDRIGYWVDLKTAYITYDNTFVESIWWILKNFWEKDLLYQGFKVVPYCPRCGTPLSDHEVAQGYDDAEDPSVFVRMRLKSDPETALLVWTTTPWTLPANVAVAAGADVDYVKVERVLHDDHTEKLILAEALVEKVFGEEPVTLLERFKGAQLVGITYEPLFSFMPLEKPAHRVILGDFVSTDDGSGLVHIAPAFGADDMVVAHENDLPVLQTVKPDGGFKDEITPWAGVFVKDADPQIEANLQERGLLFRTGKIIHTYPFCWRCSTPLLYYARPTWYIRTSAFKDRLVALNETINWYPGHIKSGRFGNWLSNNVDWALGRERYWGTPLPVWQCQECKHKHCVGSVAELSQLTGKEQAGLDLHRPHVDNVTFACQKCGGEMHRVPELIDVWFDSGSMPVAQWHYPFENHEQFKQQFPADYICEAVDQTRGWFYSLHAVSTLLNDSVAFKNVICLGLILDGDGQKMSKSKGNVVSPWDVINKNGADAMRWYLYTASPPGQERRFSSDLVSEILRNFTLTLWNTYSFFVTYANLDGWKPDPQVKPEYSALDRWVRSALHTLVRDVSQALETYDVLGATRPIETFVDQLSNWFLRRSRRRFWKSESDGDKYAAYATLYEALVTLSKLLAPTMPFMAETLHQNLVRSFNPQAPVSVHLESWPEFDAEAIDETLNQEMSLVMKLASVGHAARNKANRKVRQPLSVAAFSVGNVDDRPIVEKYADILEDELNVKHVRVLDAAAEAVAYEVKPLPKQLGQKYGPRFPAIRSAILALDSESAARAFLDNLPVMITVEGETVSILPEDVEVRATAKEGYAVAAEGAYLAALVTELTPELEMEGLAREFVRRVQDLRKTADFDIADRIRVLFQATPKLTGAVSAFAEYIKNETLALELRDALPPVDMPQVSSDFDGESVVLGVERLTL